jgi:hypothetical protein
VSLVDLVEAPPARGEKEPGLSARTVACEELIELCSAMDDDDSRREAHRFPAI